ncbi:MAG: hypothetical protein IPK15_19585 [Verrucomicrobia bacterium]|nr:hypothetical protein [Verrucomicrobiota bacterium]
MPKLNELCSEPRHLFDAYYQVHPTVYVWASFQWRDEDFTEEGMFVTEVIWAPTPAAFRRATSRDAAIAHADDGIVVTLPEPLQLAPGCTSFGGIVKFIVDQRGLKSSAIDLYDSKVWTSDGKSWVKIGHCLSVPRFTYHFRSPSPVPADELPFAASFDARDERRLKMLWTPC